MELKEGKEDIAMIKDTLKQFREEFDEHLDAINANTNEILTNYEFLCRLEAKIEKLNEKIDELQMSVLKKPELAEKSKIPSLTKHEKEIFLTLYEAGENFVTYLELGKCLGLPEELVAEYVRNLIAKGIPIVKRYVNNKSYIKIDADFLHKQTKEDILGLNKNITKTFF